MSVDKLHEDQARAARAQDLIQNELLNEAFDELEKAYIDHWRGTHVEDHAAREKLFLAVNIIGKIKTHLITVLNDGKLAAHQLRELAQAAERKKNWSEVQ